MSDVDNVEIAISLLTAYKRRSVSGRILNLRQANSLTVVKTVNISDFFMIALIGDNKREKITTPVTVNIVKKGLTLDRVEEKNLTMKFI